MPILNPLEQNPSGFIFDCDGTLLDTMGTWNEFEEQLFAQASIPFTEDEKNRLRAAPIQLGAADFYAHGVGESPEHLLEMLDNALLDFYRTKATPLPGAKEFVQAALEANIPCTVVSSSPQRYVVAGLARNDMADMFEKIVTTEDVNMSKQDPRIFLHAVDVMGSQVESTWGFDDALYAIQVLRDTGLRTCACHDYDVVGSFEQLAETADLAIRSFCELL